MLFRNFGLEHISRIAFGTTVMMLLFVAGVSASVAYPLAPTSGGGSSSGGGGLEIRGEVFDLVSHAPNATGCVGTSCVAGWNAYNFGGFWYDFKDDLMSEDMTIVNIRSRTIDKNELLYNATVRAVQFKVNSEKNLNVENGLNSALVKDAVVATDGAGIVTGGGYYAKIGWQAEEYVALNAKGNKLAKIVYQQDATDKKTLTIGEVWDIGDGYTLTAQSIDISTSPRQVWLLLNKTGVKLDDRIIVQGQAYTYNASLASETDVPIFVTYVDSVFSGATTDIIQLKYTWAVSTNVTEIKAGDKYGVMEVIEDGSIGTIKLRNTDISISLSQNSVVDVMGNMKFIVADNVSVLRFYPMVGLPPMDRFELRGNVFDDSSPTMTWNALNFPGFWYDLNTNISTEELSFLGFSGGRYIENEKLVYSTHNVKLTSKNPEISEYYMIGWQGEKFAPLYSYDASSNTVDLPVVSCLPVCSISISRWFLDDRSKSLNESETWNLGNGYTLTPTGINGNAVTLSLRQNGYEVYRTIISPGTSADVGTHTMLYNTSISGINNVPIFSAYVNVSGAKVEINHAYLLSDNPVKISLGDEIGVFTVDQIDPIVLKNNIGVSLLQDSTVDLLGNIGFKVADSIIIRFYPFTSKSLNISPPSVEMLSPPDNITIMQGEMMVLSGSARGSPDPYNYSWTSNIDGFLGNERILTFSLSPGTHKITMNVKDANGLTNTANATITVTPVITKNISGEPNVMDWNASNFPGFWYDKNAGEQTETLKINAFDGERTIDKENLWYNTTMVPMKFMVSREKNQNVEYGLNDSFSYNPIPSGGKYYNITGWFGRKYVAINGKNNKLSKLLFEQTTGDVKTLTIGETWDLGEGWALTANSIDAKTSPIYVWLELSKNGIKKDDKVSWEGGVYTYYENGMGREGNVPIFVTYIDNITLSPTTDSVRLKYTWLISENIMEIRPGDKIGLLTADMTYPLLKLKNENSITLAQGSTINIADGLRFRVNNTLDPQYYPEMTVITGLLNQPSDLTIKINNGASYTNSTSVILSISATNAQKMSFSNDGTTWSSWENYMTTRSWNLTPGNGIRTVYFKAWNNIADESSNVSDSIIIDMERPNVTNLTLSQLTPKMNDSVNITVDIEDMYLNASSIFVDVKHPSGYSFRSPMNGSKPNYYFNYTKNTSEYGRYNVTIIANDEAGNINNTEKTWFVTIKTSNTSALLNGGKGENAIGSWEWNSSNFLDFMHKENLNVTVFANRSIPIEGLLYKISREIITKDTGTSKNLTVGETLSMGAGYELTIQSLDANSTPRLVWFTLKKGEKHDGNILQEGESFIPDSGYFGEPLIFIIFDNIFHGPSTDIVRLRFGWLTSDNLVIIQPGHKFENLTVKRTSLDGLTLDKYQTLTQDMYLTNENAPINLTQDSSVKIMGDLYFKVENNANLSYYPYFKKVNTIDVSYHNLSLDLSVNSSISSRIDFTEMASVSSGMSPDLLGFKSLNKFIDIDVSDDISNNLEWVKIKIYYTQAELEASGVAEANLKVLWYNGSVWKDVTGGYDSTNAGIYTGHVWANMSHLSTFALAGYIPPSNGGGNPPSSSSGGGGGGGGGGASGENYSNIELKEKYEESIYKDKPTSYRFKNSSNPVTFVNITGNVNAGVINTAVEVLKGTSTLVKEAAPGTVYKNVNIWVGTSGFATSNNIKEAIVVFRVENSWFDSNTIALSDIKLVRWDGVNWITLETSEKIRDSKYTYFEGKTISFSPFAITGLKAASVSSTSPSEATPAQTAQAGTPEATATTGGTTPQINLFLIIGVIAILVIIAAVYIKYK